MQSRVLKIAKLELVRVFRKYGRVSSAIIIGLLILSVLALYYSISFTPAKLFCISGRVPGFAECRNPDVVFAKNRIFVINPERGFAAAAQLKEVLYREYLKSLWKNYGMKAFPVLVESNGKYVPPEYIHVGSYMQEIVVVLVFLVPIFFFSQLFYTSFFEDIILKNVEVLLSNLEPVEIVLGKMLPYLLMSAAFVAIVGIFYRYYLALLYLLPVMLIIFSLSLFFSALSRNNRDATFFGSLIAFVTAAYLILPAIFTIPNVSSLSPLYYFILYLKGEIGAGFAKSAFLITAVSAAIAYFGLHLTYPEVLSEKTLTGKLLKASASIMRREYMAPVLTLLSIPIVFAVELVVLPVQLILPEKIVFFSLYVALVEEFVKGLIIAGNPKPITAILVGSFFFLGEKALVIFKASSYPYIFLPLMLHLLSALVFLFVLRKGFWKGVLASSTVHAIYDMAVIVIVGHI